MLKRVGLLFLFFVLIITVGCKGEKVDTMETKLVINVVNEVTAPAPGEKTEVLFESHLEEGGKVLEAKAEYEIVSTSDGATIDEKGLLTITDKLNAGDANGTDIVVRVTVKAGEQKYSEDKYIHVRPYEVINEAVSENNEKKAYEIQRTCDETKYLYVNREVSGLESIVVDVSEMENFGGVFDYQVTLLKADGSIEQSDVLALDGKVTVVLNNAVAVEVSPIYRFVFGYEDGKKHPGCFRVDANTEYDENSLYGFCGERSNQSGLVLLKGAELDSCFAFVLPDGYYNVLFTKGDDSRSTIRINGGSLGSNVGNPGKGGRDGFRTYVYRMEEVKVTGGVFTFSLGEIGRTMRELEIRRATTLKERRVHIFIGGDSTASNYYPIERTEPMAGRFQTGWGQVFSQYTTGDTVVCNIAGGGTYAKSWYEMAFPGVIQHGEAGDIFLIEEGINDRTYSNQEEMVEYLTKMINECRAKGIIPVLVTAMQTPKFWKAADGTELSEFEAPYGSGLWPFAESIRELADEMNVFIVDTAGITTELYGILGRTYVARNFHIYNSATDVEEDTLHLSYAGALNTAGLIATELDRFMKEGTTDGYGQKIEGLTINPLSTKTYTFTGPNGKETSYSIPMIEAIYKAYAQ